MKKIMLLLALLSVAVINLTQPALACEDEEGCDCDQHVDNGNHYGWYRHTHHDNGNHYGWHDHHGRPPRPVDPGTGCDPKPHMGKLKIENLHPGLVELSIKAPTCVWYEVLVTEDITKPRSQWVTILIAFGTGHWRTFQMPTTGMYTPLVMPPNLIGKDRLFFTLRLHNADDPIPPL